jgi:UDP-4-amino-4,6-dideoxy-N-acetyl-beta-L-altrosamine N-acetyltransferase
MAHQKWLNFFGEMMSNACTIRELTEGDLPMVLTWRNHPSVRTFMLTQHEISLQEHRNWFERVKHEKNRKQLIVLDSSEPIGFVQFNPVSPGSIADWGFYTKPDATKGSGTKLGNAALKYAFQDLGVHKVCGQAIESNAASIAFHQKLGFIEEGRLRDQQQINGQYQTLVCFGLLANDWQQTRSTEKEQNASN